MVLLFKLTDEIGGVFLAAILFYGAFILGIFAFVGGIVKAYLKMYMVQVSTDNFSKLHELIDSTKKTLKYNGNVDAYVWVGSPVGFQVLNHLDRKIFIIKSSSLDSKPDPEIIKYLVMFNVARIKTRSEYVSLITQIISGIEKLKLFNFLFYSFERATVYTADRVAAIYCGDVCYAKTALTREMVGSDLSKYMNIESVEKQHKDCNSILAWFARSYLPTPGYSNRYSELSKFAEKKDELFKLRNSA